MKKSVKKEMAGVCTGAMLIACFGGCGAKDTDTDTVKEKKFTPSLDTEVSTSLEIAGFMANFEALDQVVNDFNEYYPNVTVTYEQNDTNSLADYLVNNSYVDVFMTNVANVSVDAPDGAGVLDDCLDLSKEDIDVSDVDSELLQILCCRWR